MKNIPLLLATLVGTFVIIFGVAFLFSKSNTTQEVDAATVVAGARHFFTQAETQTEGNEATESAQAPQAKIQIVEFSDFQCPACRAAEPIRGELTTMYPDQVEFVYRHYPLTSIHPNAMLAAQASEAAATFGKFWEMHDELFANQLDWSDLSNADARNMFLEYANSLEINTDEFESLLDDATIKQHIQTDINSGNQLRISATPTFFVNGQKVSAPDVIPTVEKLLNQ